MRTRINKTYYRFAHGSDPKGRGNWHLTIKIFQQSEQTFQMFGVLGDVIREARKRYPEADEIIINS